MNSNIKKFLDFYIEDPDPRYAVAIDGEWGSGKTFFTDAWTKSLIKSSKSKHEKDNAIVLKPISVSLYGKNDISQIISEIDRTLHPILNSKWVKGGAKVINLLGKIALNTKFKIDGQEIELSSSLDSLNILRDKDNNITGNKLFIFDDFERSNIDTKQLLGFINWLIEKANCHVVIVGDFSKLKTEANEIFNEFKEKTIGRTLKITPDTTNALKAFLKEIPECGWTTNQADLILKCQYIVESKNLRILRHLIRDFNGAVDKIDFTNITQKQETFLKSFLASFVISANLYHDAKTNTLIKNYAQSYVEALMGNKKDDFDVLDLQNRIDSISTELGSSVIDPNVINKIIQFLEGKCLLTEFLEEKLEEVDQEAPIFDQLSFYYNLEEDQFDNLYNQLVEHVKAFDMSPSYELGRCVDFLCLFDNSGIEPVSDELIKIIQEKASKIIKTCESAEELYKIKVGFLSGCNCSRTSNPKKDTVLKNFNKIFTERLTVIPAQMQLVLRSLNNDNVDQLMNLDNESAPDGESKYNLQSIFMNESVDDLIERISHLSNKSRRIFNSFLRHHYQVDINVINFDLKRYEADLKFIRSLKDGIEQKKDTLKGKIEKLSYNNLSSTLEQILDKLQPA